MHETKSEPLSVLQQEWTTLWTITLPRYASARVGPDSEKKWPFCVDHSIARVILDAIMGKPWPRAVQPPATKNMSEKQLEACIALAHQLLNDQISVWDLEVKSLTMRGLHFDKSSYAVATGQKIMQGVKRKRDHGSTTETAARSLKHPQVKKPSSKQLAADGWKAVCLHSGSPNASVDEEEILPDIQFILHSAQNLTPFKRHALLMLTQVPRGCFTTYQAISKAMGKGNGRSVGEAMRTNPFAPTVACHRMVSSDGRVGGWHGDWDQDGGFFLQKKRLLEEEGVQFDEKDRVVGTVFTEFISTKLF